MRRVKFMKMKKFLRLSIFVLVMLFVVTGCTTSKSYTFKVETGDEIKIELNTDDGYNISSELPIKISKDGKVLSQGAFISLADYDSYMNTIKNGGGDIEVLESKTENGLEYTFYSYNGSEFNYVIKISESNTAFLLGNNISKDSAEECFDRLTITKK